MTNLQYATFVSSEYEIHAACLALASLKRYQCAKDTPIVLIPEEVVEKYKQLHPDAKLERMIKKFGGVLKVGFKKGYNERNSLRAVLTNLARRVGSAPLVYFAPGTIFFKDVSSIFQGPEVIMPRSPDVFWPIEELYGPSVEDIWRAVVQVAGVEPEKWFNMDEPKNYWRRYPLTSSRLIYMPEPAAFAQLFEAESKALIALEVPELVGQDRDLVEPALTISLIKSGGKLIDFDWDIDAQAFDSFPQLMLRMRKEFFDDFKESILMFPATRQVFKQNIDLRYYFYHKKIQNIRSGLDEIERSFSMIRMNKLIERRKIQQAFKKLISEAKENKEQEKVKPQSN